MGYWLEHNCSSSDFLDPLKMDLVHELLEEWRSVLNTIKEKAMKSTAALLLSEKGIKTVHCVNGSIEGSSVDDVCGRNIPIKKSTITTAEFSGSSCTVQNPVSTVKSVSDTSFLRGTARRKPVRSGEVLNLDSSMTFSSMGSKDADEELVHEQNGLVCLDKVEDVCPDAHEYIGGNHVVLQEPEGKNYVQSSEEQRSSDNEKENASICSFERNSVESGKSVYKNGNKEDVRKRDNIKLNEALLQLKKRRFDKTDKPTVGASEVVVPSSGKRSTTNIKESETKGPLFNVTSSHQPVKSGVIRKQQATEKACDLYKQAIDVQLSSSQKREIPSYVYEPKTKIPKLEDESNAITDVPFCVPDFAKDPAINFKIKGQDHGVLEEYFSNGHEVDVEKLFPHVKNISNNSPNKWPPKHHRYQSENI